MTQLEMMTSTELSATGRCSISPSRNSTFSTAAFAAFSRAFSSISGVMSTPMTRPVGPTFLAARKQSMPAAGAQVEDGLARLQRRERDRVAAAEAEVRALGDGRQLLGRVADHLAGFIRAEVRLSTTAGRCRRCAAGAFSFAPPERTVSGRVS